MPALGADIFGDADPCFQFGGGWRYPRHPWGFPPLAAARQPGWHQGLRQARNAGAREIEKESRGTS